MNIWKLFVDYGRQLIALTRKVQQHEADLADCQQELRSIREELSKLADAVQHVQWELHHDRELSRRDYENLILRLENHLLRSGQGPLPDDSTQNPPELPGP